MRYVRWLRALFRLTVGRAALFRRIRNRITYPGLGIVDSVSCDINGEFRWGTGTNIGDASVLVAPAGSRLILGNHCYIGRHCELGSGGFVSIGDQTSIQDRTVILGNVSIGRYCVLSYNIYLSSGRHEFRKLPYALIRDQDDMARGLGESDASRDGIVIEEDCWIGINVVIQPGVRIGRGCIVGANAVVTKDLPPYSVAAGVPAKTIGVRLDFKPPREISSQRDEDLPYFYRGFLGSNEELALSKQRGGVISLDKFALALDSREMTEVHLEVRSLAEEDVSLTHGDTGHSVGRELREYSYRIKEHDCPIEFAVDSKLSAASVIVRRAWVT